jgi:polar amino acid transport system permease protein
MYQWDFGSLWQFRSIIGIGFVYTLSYTVACIALGLLVGLVVGLGRLSTNPSSPAAARLRRSVPLHPGAGAAGVVLLRAAGVAGHRDVGRHRRHAVACAVRRLHAEIIRGGIVSIDLGQSEAGWALGMTRFQLMKRVILPQAFKRMTPPLVNQSIMQLKNTSLLSVLAVPDLLYQGQIIAHETYRPLEVYTLVAIIYFIILLPATILAKRLENRLSAQHG